MIDPIVRQGTMNYKTPGFKMNLKKVKSYFILLCWMTLCFYGQEGRANDLFECADGPLKKHSTLLSIDFGEQQNKSALLFRFQVWPFYINGAPNNKVASFLETWGISPKEFKRPIFELSLKTHQCRVDKEDGSPLVDCFLSKGTTFRVRDAFGPKVREGLLSWGQLHIRKKTETFIMFRSEDGQFKKRHEQIKLFLTGRNKAGGLSRIDSIYDRRFCFWD